MYYKRLAMELVVDLEQARAAVLRILQGDLDAAADLERQCQHRSYEGAVLTFRCDHLLGAVQDAKEETVEMGPGREPFPSA